MILVDVEIPALYEAYDFELDEERKVDELIADIAALAAEKTDRVKKGREELYLYAYYTECLLDGEKSLREQGIETGEKLILL